jgi:hypothetical protein
LSLKPIQTRNLRDYNNTSSPEPNACGFFDIFPASQPERSGNGAIGAFSSGQRVFCADPLHDDVGYYELKQTALGLPADDSKQANWRRLFDGKTLNGWKVLKDNGKLFRLSSSRWYLDG